MSALDGVLVTASRGLPRLRRSAGAPLAFDDWAGMFSLDKLALSLTQSLRGPGTEPIDGAYESLAARAYQSNGPVFSCMLARFSLGGEARFQFQALRNGRPGELFGNADLGLLETPWPNGTTRDLLNRGFVDVDLAGNHFVVNLGTRLFHPRPDWVWLAWGSRTEPNGAIESVHAWDPNAEFIGIGYQPGGLGSGGPIYAFGAEQVAHWAPYPDPASPWRGMSWLTPILRDLQGDAAATTIKTAYFDNGITPNYVVSLDPQIRKEAFDEWVDAFEKEHRGALNAYRTIYLGAGAKVEKVGDGMGSTGADLKSIQGGLETRIAAAAGVPPVIAGFSEGLQAATYSNYGQARRRFADLTMRPLWGGIAGAYAAITRVPAGSRLWYDDRDIPFLQEDVKDAADIVSVQASSIRTLVDSGFDPVTVVDAITSGDLARLSHLGVYSVQLIPPNPDGTAPSIDAGRTLAGLVAPHLPGLLPQPAARTSRDRERADLAALTNGRD